jgi:hypothetical protein
MKTEEFLSDLRYYKRAIRRIGTRMMLSNMIIQNIEDIIPKGWELVQDSSGTIKLSPPKETTVTADIFEKTVKHFAKCLVKEPSVNITETEMTASFYVYPAGNHETQWDSFNESYEDAMKNVKNNDHRFRYESILFSVVINNSEKCEITYKRKMTKVPELTGYCKLLAERESWLKEKNHEKVNA